LKQDDDIELITNIQKNSKEAFDRLFRKYYIPLCRFAFKLNGSEEIAEEVVQEIFIMLWEQRQRVSISKTVTGYLFQAVRNKVYENFRKNQTRIKYEEEYISLSPEPDIAGEAYFDEYEMATMIWNAVEQLPDKCREIFQLSRDEGLTYNEISVHLRISVKTVENQMGIAFKKLREILMPLLKTTVKTSHQRDQFLTLFFLFLGFSLLISEDCPSSKIKRHGEEIRNTSKI
jgi:RNA polymerase sigma-70 factor, ECF subfamily